MSRSNGSGNGTTLPEKALVIVESPTKARTISGFLPKGFVVEASVGHVRDLPESAREIPEEIKAQPWGRLGIDIDNDFLPYYVVPADKKKNVTKLRQALKEAEVVYLATDEDREGESISWHLVEVLNPKIPQRRLVFHEITREAIQSALESPRELDDRLVRAQEARRILDRLYGYQVSPILWRKVGPGLSAGRVQSVAVRLIVMRERDRRRFVRSQYWDLSATFGTPRDESFTATLISLGGQRIASGKDFDPETGKLKADAKVVHLDEEGAAQLADRLKNADWKVSKLELKPYTERPAPPFTTSTMQQEANRKLRMSARQTMQGAQRLYERGLITYMRTDSTSLADQAVEAAREHIQRLYGSEFVPDAPRSYRTKVKNAQEAHEAIRPSMDFRRPDEVTGLDERDRRLYELIWKRTMACQMADAKGFRTTLQASGEDAVFQVTGKTIEFPGFLRAYVEGADDPQAELSDKESVLPKVQEGEPLKPLEIDPHDHSTQPPARYTEASLVKELEARGIGRPSTYASIIDTILRREYVAKNGNALVPSFTAFAVTGLLERFFSRLVDFTFTARMEDELDAISLGDAESLPYLKSFYYGDQDTDGLQELLGAEIDAREVCTLPLGVDENGEPVAVRVGRYGPYIERGEDRGSIPAEVAPDEITLERAIELLEMDQGPQELGNDPATGQPIYLKNGRFGFYVQLGDGEDGEKPKMKSLLPNMVPESVRLEEAAALLSLPRTLGAHPELGEDIVADYGRYGGYIRCGSETRSLASPEEVFTVDIPAAVELLKQEKRGRSRQPKALKEVGAHPESGEMIRLMDGRYGPYVTDGTTNASIPKDADADKVTVEQAVEWIAERMARGPAKRRKKKAKKKAAKKKATKKKASKKKASKKKASKKKTTKKKASKKKPDSDGEGEQTS